MSDTPRNDDLIRQAPSGYLWNQAYSLWLFLSLFLYQLVITRVLPVSEKGIYELVLTPANFAIYLAALGLESAGSVYLPRVLAARGRAAAMGVALRLCSMRVVAMTLVAAGVLWGLPALAAALAPVGLPGMAGLAQAAGNPVLIDHRLALAVYLLGTSAANLVSALLTALMRTRIVFIAGGIAQLLAVLLAYAFVGPLHGGANGALYAMTLPIGATALVYTVALFRALGGHMGRLGQRVTAPMLRLGFAAWLTDLANGSLIKLVAVAQLSIVVTNAQIAFFGVAFEMGHAAAFLFVAGLGGVGLAVMAAAFASNQREHLATAWRSISKMQIVLAVPLLAFCIPHADAIIHILYGNRYAVTGPLLALFLGLNALVRLGGGGASEAALYVLGHQRWVVVARWGSLGVLALGDVLLIPRYGVAGALFAVGVAQVAAEFFELGLARFWLRRAYPVGFIVRVLLALAPALAFALAWRPQALAPLLLAGMGYAVLFLIGLRVVRPLDAEDRALLDQVAAPLRALLLPFVGASGTTRPHEPSTRDGVPVLAAAPWHQGEPRTPAP